MKDSTGLESAEDSYEYKRLDRFVDRLTARLWGAASRRGVLFVFTMGRGDLMLLSHVLEHYRPLLEPGERADILLRDGIRNLEFVVPEWVRIGHVPARRFQKHALTRLFWSLRIARRRYRRAVTFNIGWSPLRDERIAELATGGAVPDSSISFPNSEGSRKDMRERLGRSRYFLNSDERHTVTFWADFAAHLTGEPTQPVTPRFDPARLGAPQRAARPHVLLHPFPSFASKFFPPEVYAPLLEELAPTHDVLVSTGPGDLEKYPQMQALAEYPHVRTADQTLDEMVPLVRGADLVIAVDTALAHLGIGCGAPTLVLHNTDDSGVYVPYPPELCPPDTTFLAIEIDPAVRRRGWKPYRPWEPAPGSAARVREAALALLRRD